MPVEVRWFNDDREIILNVITGKWDWDEFLNTRVDELALMSSVSYPVASIFDATQLQGGIPDFIRKSGKLMEDEMHPNNSGIIVVIGFAPLMRTFTNIMLRLYHSTMRQMNVYVANNMSDAVAFIAHERAKRAGKQ